MTTTAPPRDLQSIVMPVFAFFVALFLCYAVPLIVPEETKRTTHDVLTSVSQPLTEEPSFDVPIEPVPLESVAATTRLEEAEDRLVRNMEFFDSRFERFTADLRVAEDKALSRSDLVGTRYELRALQDQLVTLRDLTREWDDINSELLSDRTGQQIAAGRDLLEQYVLLADQPRLSQRDVEELTERLEPLSQFIAMLEDQDKVPYEPGERFQTRLVSMNGHISEAVREYEDSLAELRRMMRESRSQEPGEEILRDAMSRWRLEQKRRAASSTAAVPADTGPAKSEAPPEASEPPSKSPKQRRDAPPGRTMLAHRSVLSRLKPYNPDWSQHMVSPPAPVERQTDPVAEDSRTVPAAPAPPIVRPPVPVSQTGTQTIQTRCRCGPCCRCRHRCQPVHRCVLR
ncbi:hypothetical protein [Fuerstiella marisgermanici]|uniref:Uncharacterized protein n=1 Tax=Fuerstiella marisgermanici TaxID=1891926 RepID=A0A1P8WQP7_9PLAN|nr:hypothetical protein [Fuerstiella marisgermanici]APZ96372.1 hypothetical protein Fuma_06041 [Fuerstiella marisgermanici]